MSALKQIQPLDLNTLETMLDYIDADTDRTEWVKTLMAIKCEFGDDAKAIAREWSATASNFNAGAFNATWKSIKANGGVTIASLIHQAKQNGFHFAPINQDQRQQLAKLAKQRHQAQIKAQAEEKQRIERQYQQASRQANQILANATIAPDDHPYLKRKSIASHGALCGNVFTYQNALIIPVFGTCNVFAGEVQSLQFIQPDGAKRFLTGGKMKGGHYPIQWIEDAPIVICEGFATGATLAEHFTPFSSVICAFNAGNLLSVATAFKRQYPMRQIIIAGDNDHQTEKTTGINTGKQKAIEAAKAIDGLVSIPMFEEWETGTDWNDRYLIDQQEKALLDFDNVLMEGYV